RRYSHARFGFTLIELVMVLVILAILATAALNVVDVRVDEARFDASQQTIQSLDTAVLGPENARSADGSRSVSGFVADCGRLPRSLEELYSFPSGLVPAFGNAAPAGDSEVTLSGGWNGPYLRLPIGGASLSDGWGQPFDLFQADGLVSAANEPLAIIRSFGRDVELGGTDYDADVSLVFEADASAVTAGLASQEENRWQQSVTAYIYYNDSTRNPDVSKGNRIVVRVYGPVADAMGSVTLGTISQVTTNYSSEAPVSVTLPSLAIGPRVIRVYQTMADPTSENQDLSTVSQAISVPTRLVVSRETTSIQLILRDN
ncbi:MAG: prepilin-type N-terminal cleavage/methylation domain-containing protein, partial [Planctomycetota bacterium]